MINFRDTNFNSNATLMYAAAKQLNYHITDVVVNGKKHPGRYGFYVKKGQKNCYISTKACFPNVQRWQLALMNDKIITTAVLEQFGFSIIKTISFTDNQEIKFPELSETILSQPLPVLLKPTSGSDGSGVQLCYDKKQVEKIILSYYNANESFLAQQFIEQDEYRIMVVNEEIMFIHKKKFPVVTGDGIQTIASLIASAKYTDKMIIDRELKQKNLTLDSVLQHGAYIKTHITKKSDPAFYLTNDFPVVLQEWVKKVCQALGVETVGIDVFIDGPIAQPKKISIIELNSKPGLNYIVRYYKDRETPLRIARRILQEYFS